MSASDPQTGPEGPALEWKERLPRRDRVAALLAAFANGEGGTVLVGVRDDGSVCGVRSPEEVRAALRAALGHLDPRPRLAVRVQERNGHEVVEARVMRSGELVRLVRPDGSLSLYLRDGSSTRIAGPGEERALARVSRSEPVDRELLSLLAALDRARSKTLPGVARAARKGQRAAKRGLVRLARAGLALERADGRWWLTPRGHARLARRRGG